MRTHLVDDAPTPGDHGSLAVDGRARDLSLLAERIIRRTPTAGVIVRDVPGNR